MTARRSVAYLTGGGLLSTALYAIGGVILGRLVDPATLGLFQGIGLALTYAGLLQLGILSGLSRELPYSVGRGDRARAEELCAVAQAWALGVGVVVAVALLGVAVWQLTRGELLLAAGWFTNVLLAIQLFYTGYLQVTYRTAADFARIALVRVIGQSAAVALLVLVVPLDFYGLCLRALLGGALSVVLLVRWRPVRVGPAWNMGHFRHLLRIGLPIFIVGQILSYWVVIDQTLVLKLGGTRMMGLYAMVMIVRTAVDTLPVAIGQVFFPRMSQKRGEGESVRQLIAGLAKPTLGAVAIAIPVLVISWWLIVPATRLLIPQYADAVSAMRWALPMCVLACLDPAIALFAVVRRQGLRLVGMLAGVAAYAVSLRWLIQDGVHLTAFPQAMLIGQAVYVFICCGFIWYLAKSEKEGGDSMR